MTMATPTSSLHAGESGANERRSSAPTSFLKRPSTAAVADKSLSSGRSLGSRTVSQRNVQHSVSSGEGKWLKQANKRELNRSLSRSAHSHRSRRSLLSRGLSGRGIGGQDDNLAASWHNALANSSHSAGGLGLSRSGTKGGGRLVKSNHTHGGGGDFLSKREEELFSAAAGRSLEAAPEPSTTKAIPQAIATKGSKESTDVCAEEEDEDEEEDEFAKLAGRAGRTAVDFDAGDDAVELSFTEDVGVASTAAAAALPMEFKREAAPETSVEAPDEEGGASASSTSEGSSRVTFSSCTVRYYNTILGDNPFVSSGGPPLSLGWDYDPSATDADVPLDAYESARSHLRRTGWDLILGRAERERRLLNVGCTRHAIAEGVREVLKSKNRMRSTVLNLRMSGVEEWMEGCSRAVTRGARMRKSSRCLYDEWIASGGTAAAVTTDMLRVLEPSSSPENEEVETSEGETALTSSSLTSAKAAGEETSRKGLASGKNSERAAPVGPAFGISRLRMGSLRGERLLLSDDDDDDDAANEGDEKKKGAPAIIAEGRNDETEDEARANVTAAVPFAVVDLVFPGSPAAEAGFKKGDGIVRFGKVTGSTNHRNLRAVTDAGAAAAAAERAVSVVVLRRVEEEGAEGNVELEEEGAGGDEGAATVVVRLSFRPRAWSGAGNFGFLLKRCSPSKGTEFCHSLSAKALL